MISSLKLYRSNFHLFQPPLSTAPRSAAAPGRSPQSPWPPPLRRPQDAAARSDCGAAAERESPGLR